MLKETKKVLDDITRELPLSDTITDWLSDVHQPAILVAHIDITLAVDSLGEKDKIDKNFLVQRMLHNIYAVTEILENELEKIENQGT